MDEVRVVYARGRSPASHLIRLFPDSAPARWSHAGVVIGDHVFEARFPHGAVMTPREKFNERYTEIEEVVFGVPDSGQGMLWLMNVLGRPYATGTVIGMAFGLRMSNKGDHCIEIVENFLAECGLRRWRGDLHLIKPNASYHNTAGVLR